MENPKNQLAAKLKDANNVLVTVSTNPSVDQLAAAIGLTLFLTKLKKHATSVFSGQVPSTIDFLKPEETIEDNTDSLRDFIISLDKNKADKIRYKVEDQMVKIFITPYRTSIGDQDLVFSQGDFNVDVVIALGVHNKEDVDQAITAHGRILHDATVATINTKEGSDIGTLNWVDQQASSLCEMAVALTDLIKANSLDGQMATAFLTGIVAETERFSNEKTASTTMNASAKLMAAGANQQLVATKLEPPEETPPPAPEQPQGPEDGEDPKDISIDDDGSLRIDHESTIPETDESKPTPPPSDTLPPPVMPEAEEPETPETPPVSQVKIDDEGQLEVEEPHIKQEHRQFLGGHPAPEDNKDMFGVPGSEKPAGEETPAGSAVVTEPPKFGGQLSAAADDSSTSSSPLNLPPANTPILSHDSGAAKKDEDKKEDKKSDDSSNKPPGGASGKPPAQEPPPPRKTGQAFVDMGDKTLDDIEQKAGDNGSGKLPKQFVKSLDTSTLSGLEEKVESPHLKARPKQGEEPEVDYHKAAAEQVAKAVSGKTLNEIEQKVDSPHMKTSPPNEPAVLPPAGGPKADEGPKLDYEPHESEPPDTVAVPADDSAASDNNQQPPQDDAATKDAQADDSTAAAADDTKPADSAAAKNPAEESPTTKDTATKDVGPKADEARDAVMQAISSGGDGRTSLPALESIGAAGAMPVSHDDGSQSAPQSQKPSPNIDIDEKGNLTFPQNLVPTSDELPADATAAPADDAGAPPPVPPPMMPPMSSPAENGQNT